jgi:hypothetical protein
MGDSPPREQATLKERNDLLVALLKEHYSGLIDFEFKQGTVLTLVVGWILSSEVARRTFAADGIAAGAVCVSVALLAIFHAVWVRRFCARSEVVYKRIGELNYIDIKDVESGRIRPFTEWSFILIHSVVSVMICVLVIRAR